MRVIHPKYLPMYGPGRVVGWVWMLAVSHKLWPFHPIVLGVACTVLAFVVVVVILAAWHQQESEPVFKEER